MYEGLKAPLDNLLGCTTSFPLLGSHIPPFLFLLLFHDSTRLDSTRARKTSTLLTINTRLGFEGSQIVEQGGSEVDDGNSMDGQADVATS